VTAEVLVAACLAAVAVMASSRIAVPPRRALQTRLRPYASLHRVRLGTGYPDPSIVDVTRRPPASAVVEVFGPMLARAARALSTVVDAGDSDAIERRLRQAGIEPASAEQHRMRQLGHATAGVAVGVCLGLVVFRSGPMTLLMAACLGFPAATVQRNRVSRAIDHRRERMRSEVYTVAHLLAVLIRTGHGPVDAVRSVSAVGRGPVVEELREALGWISGGTSPQRAWDKLAEATPEPTAARLYRLLSASARGGGDLARPLLAVADDLRAERREQLARAAVRRRTAMLLPLLGLIAPVMVLFIGAALPSLVLGVRG
jgi:tight adherence protein C